MSSDSDKDNPDEENSDEEIFEKIQIKKNFVEEDSSEKSLVKKNTFFSTYINITKSYLTIEEIIT